MSSFICSAKHFNSIEESLKKYVNSRDFYAYKLKNLYPVLFRPKEQLYETVEKQITDIVNELRKLNVICVSLQYKHHYDGRLNEEIKEQEEIAFDRSEGYKELSLHGLYNALNCLNYQIELEHLEELTGNKEAENKAYQFLQIMTENLAHYLVRKLPEDNTNRWSID